MFGDYLDLAVGCNLVESRISVRDLISDHSPILLQSTVSEHTNIPHIRRGVSVPCNSAKLGKWYAGYTAESVDSIHTDMVAVIKEFHDQYVLPTHPGRGKRTARTPGLRTNDHEPLRTRSGYMLPPAINTVTMTSSKFFNMLPENFVG